MPNKNILDFARVTGVQATDYFHISRGGVDSIISGDQLIANLNGGTPFNVTPRDETSNTRTASIADINGYVRFVSSGLTTYTIGPEATYGWVLGQSIVGRNAGDGSVIGVGDVDVTVNPSPSGSTMTVKGQTCQWLYVGNDEWDFITGAGGDGTSINVLPFSSTVAPDIQEGSLRTVQLTGDIVIDEPTNASLGSALTLSLTSDGSSRTVTFNGVFKLGSTSTTISANTTSIYKFVKQTATDWYLHSFTEGL